MWTFLTSYSCHALFSCLVLKPINPLGTKPRSRSRSNLDKKTIPCGPNASEIQPCGVFPFLPRKLMHPRGGSSNHLKTMMLASTSRNHNIHTIPQLMETPKVPRILWTWPPPITTDPDCSMLLFVCLPYSKF